MFNDHYLLSRKLISTEKEGIFSFIQKSFTFHNFKNSVENFNTKSAASYPFVIITKINRTKNIYYILCCRVAQPQAVQCLLVVQLLDVVQYTFSRKYRQYSSGSIAQLLQGSIREVVGIHRYQYQCRLQNTTPITSDKNKNVLNVLSLQPQSIQDTQCSQLMRLI